MRKLVHKKMSHVVIRHCHDFVICFLKNIDFVPLPLQSFPLFLPVSYGGKRVGKEENRVSIGGGGRRLMGVLREATITAWPQQSLWVVNTPVTPIRSSASTLVVCSVGFFSLSWSVLAWLYRSLLVCLLVLSTLYDYHLALARKMYFVHSFVCLFFVLQDNST